MADDSGIMGKAKDELGKLMDDPTKVDEAKTKAEGVLGKYMDQQQADEVTNEAEGALKDFVDRSG